VRSLGKEVQRRSKPSPSRPPRCGGSSPATTHPDLPAAQPVDIRPACRRHCAARHDVRFDEALMGDSCGVLRVALPITGSVSLGHGSEVVHNLSSTTRLCWQENRDDMGVLPKNIFLITVEISSLVIMLRLPLEVMRLMVAKRLPHRHRAPACLPCGPVNQRGWIPYQILGVAKRTLKPPTHQLSHEKPGFGARSVKVACCD
jgi:hypothetical protein